MKYYLSPTLDGLEHTEIENMPPVWAACQQCPASIWQMSGPIETSKGQQQRILTCYCQPLHVVIWSQDERSAPEHCDAQVLALAQMKASQKGVG